MEDFEEEMYKQKILSEIRESLYAHYNVTSDYDKESGCYHNGNWFSIAEVMRIIEEVLE